MDRTQLIKRIHMLKRNLALIDEDYRTVLISISGKSSCKDLDVEYLNLVCVALERMQRSYPGTSTTIRNAKQQRQIARLMDFLNWNWKATATFCFHQVGKRSTKSCDARELSKVIMGMVRIIDADIEKGRLKLSPEQLEEYQKHTKLHRNQSLITTHEVSQ